MNRYDAENGEKIMAFCYKKG